MKTLSARENALVYNALLEKAVENRAAAKRLGEEPRIAGANLDVSAGLALVLQSDADLCEELAEEFVTGIFAEEER